MPNSARRVDQLPFVTNLEAWIVAIQLFFHQFQTPEEQHVNLAYHHLRVSSNWVTQYEESTTYWRWSAFLGALRAEFVETDSSVQQKQSEKTTVEEVNQTEQEMIFKGITSQDKINSIDGSVEMMQGSDVRILDVVLKDRVECKENYTELLSNSSFSVGHLRHTSHGKVNLDVLVWLELLVQGNHNQVPSICWCYYGHNVNCNDNRQIISCVSSFATFNYYPISVLKGGLITKYMEFLLFKFKEYNETIDYDDVMSENMEELVSGYPKSRDSQSTNYGIELGEECPYRHSFPAISVMGGLNALSIFVYPTDFQDCKLCVFL